MVSLTIAIKYILLQQLTHQFSAKRKVSPKIHCMLRLLGHLLHVVHAKMPPCRVRLYFNKGFAGI